MFKPTSATTPDEYITSIAEPRKTEIIKVDSYIRQIVPDLKPFIISGMIGYGPYRYKSKSGREGDWAVILLASQKNYISLYACGMSEGQYVAEKYKQDLPKANIGKSCIRFKIFEDLNKTTLEKILLECKKNPLSAV